ncbi:2-amino-4-hydroxy-6-hydroxymethyldihydropteridine diphosphokinase [Sneathiella sp.]|uniref:2-amino-4-hydroxy-6- hydroxymethyldihydropteridine diphosphokinase n=1 Tax=Sneathiella sp. TaxID=1964365 RepID=UPI00262A2444|nr:2-amino-4-hydroxy-6-hydroxymethyldihydropteridine diphosphokinase [Sneathiella sp.]MDF2366010.1 2-amino-4-hydroxy-6-hydroxymethyldihydropteridine diphosphokinase [Sneathiella sp.]
MILIGLGANMPHPDYSDPLNTLTEVVRRFRGVLHVARQSSWYRSAPVPASDQPWFVNAVLAVETDMSEDDLLQMLHKIERDFGRIRRQRWEARVLDLDLLAYHDRITENQDQLAGPVLPHPHMQERAFVLAPIHEIAPGWRHPVSGLRASELLKMLPSEQPFDIVGPDDISC